MIVTQQRVGYRLAAPVIRLPLQKRPQSVSFKPRDPVPGRDLWRLFSPLGQGGNGEVWRGEHSKTGEARVSAELPLLELKRTNALSMTL